MQILGGTISYEDGIKTVQGDQFSPTRKVRVELNFSLDATDANGSTDPAIQIVIDKAQAFVTDKLGLKVPTAAAAVERRHAFNPDTHEVVNGEVVLKKSAAVTVATDLQTSATPKAPRAPKKPAAASSQVDLEELTGPTKADLEKAAGVPAKGLPEKGALKLVDDALEVSGEAKPAPATDINDISDLTGTPAKQYSDADLNDAAQKAMARINSPDNPGGPRIRKLVSTYLAEGVQPVMSKVPQERRAEFLKELSELK